ncbi:hypothetical protein JKP88DRAFT_223485 [Tribonema minus]|uniref:Uncharacterized protein n=1 Tax=Tribonema minus TaxID=303371 RepID=A0A835YZN1_9STRA|nr:hypothetical protein JKP88DRAFT_223485 [Tribonema minus]
MVPKCLRAHADVLCTAAAPNSNGGAVCYNTRTFAGTQVRTTYHPDSTHHVPLQPIEDQPPQDQIDKDRANMWPVRHLKQASAHGGSERRRTAAADAASMAEEFHQLPLHDMANTLLKNQLALFVPAQTILVPAARARAIELPTFRRTNNSRG